MFTLITGGEVFTPSPLGRRDVLICGGTIAAIDVIDRRAIEATHLDVDVIDASGSVVVPGLIDPHHHLIGGSGEEGFHSQTPEVRIDELITAGITTVVGCIGVDATTRTMPALLAKAKGLNHYGITARIYSGGYAVPPATLTGSIRTDIMFIEEVIGAGEIAISDRRSTEPSTSELSRLVRDAYAGGLLSGKAGVTHFHLGDEPPGIAPLRALLDECHIDPAILYPTHLERNPRLMNEGIELTRRGVTIDLDVVERDLPQMVRQFIDGDGDFEHLTASSDASITSCGALLDQVRDCVRELKMPLERVLPLVTTNTARVLKLSSKGRIAQGADADLLVMNARSLEPVAVIASGRVLMRDGSVTVRETWVDKSDRRVSVHGEKGEAAIA
jgi:beta-aspartyl-dipeptidase (metallo-type)